MAKKLISVWLSLTILLFSTITIYAEDYEVVGYYLNRNIDINGNRIANYYLDCSFYTYEGSTYFPLSDEMGDLMGFDVEMDWESRTLKILKTQPTRNELSEKVLKNNLENCKATVLNDMKVLLLSEEDSKLTLPVELEGVFLTACEINIGKQLEEIKKEAELIQIPKLTVEKMDLKDCVVLEVDGTVYLPIRTIVDNSCFGWDVYYDNYSGIYISTQKGVTAYSFFDKDESYYNKGLANYIISKNKKLSLGGALMQVFLFKHEADVNGVDELLLISMAERESGFRPDVVGGGAVGLMQIMPSTAAKQGVSREELFDPHVNIEFGARYISSHLDKYDDRIIALSAYNHGTGAVSRGNYNTRYANRVTGARETLKDYLLKNGYGLGK